MEPLTMKLQRSKPQKYISEFNLLHLFFARFHFFAKLIRRKAKNLTWQKA